MNDLMKSDLKMSSLNTRYKNYVPHLLFHVTKFRSAPPPLTWNPGSAPDINLNMYIINVIADDESKISLYEI
jgi:hypothetical protein